MLAGYIARVEDWDYKPGRWSGGLKTVATSSSAFCAEHHGAKAVGNMCLARGSQEDVPFSLEHLSAQRRAARTCHEIHPGLCRHDDEKIYSRAKRLGKNMFDQVSTLKMVPGESLIEVAGKYFWLLRRMGKPQRMYFAQADRVVIDGENGEAENYIDVRRPLCRMTNYSIAVQLLKETPRLAQWTVRSVEHRSNRGPLWRTLEVGFIGDGAFTATAGKAPKPPVDPLEEALQKGHIWPKSAEEASSRLQEDSGWIGRQH